RPGQIEMQVRWRSGTITKLDVKRAAPGEGSLKTPLEAVSRIHEMAGQHNYTDIAAGLNDAGFRTAFGGRFTSQNVGYICRRDKLTPRSQRRKSSRIDNLNRLDANS